MKQDKQEPPDIFMTAWEVRAGTAEPTAARQLLEYFCTCVDNGQRVPKELSKHLRDSFRCYLDGKTIDAALGLAKKKGRPSPDNTKMAVEVLRSRLAGNSHQVALEIVAESFKCVDSTVGEAWRKHNGDALLILRLEREKDNYPWNEKEIEELTNIYKNQEWFYAPK